MKALSIIAILHVQVDQYDAYREKFKQSDEDYASKLNVTYFDDLGNFPYVWNQTNVTCTLTEDGTFTVEGTGAMDDPTSEHPAWYSFRNYIQTVTVSQGVTTISKKAFKQSAVSSVTLPLSLTLIDDHAFSNCAGLTSVNIPAAVTVIGDYAFCNNSITAINLPKGLTTIGDYAFYGTQIINVTIPRTATTLGSNIFANCQQLRTATFQEGCTTVGVKMFEAEEFQDAYGWPEYRTNLREVNLPNSLTTIGAQAFSYCVNLPNITIPVNVTLIDNEAFKWCYNMQNVYCYPNPANLTWTGASNSFDGNQSTQCHVLPQYLDAYQTKFGYNAGTGNNDATGVRVVFVGDLNCSVFTTAGNWNEANNWSNNMVPSAGSDVIISANVTIPSGYTADAGNVAIMTGNTLAEAHTGYIGQLAVVTHLEVDVGTGEIVDQMQVSHFHAVGIDADSILTVFFSLVHAFLHLRG